MSADNTPPNPHLPKGKKVVLNDIHHGAPKSSPENVHLYAHVRDAESGDIIISSTLHHAIESIEKYGWLVVKDLIKKENGHG